MKFRTEDSATWQPGWLMANVWLAFLAFPIASVLVDDDLTATRQVVGVFLLGLLAVIHGIGYWVMIRREMGLVAAPTSAGVGRLTDPARSELWFGLLVLTLAAGWLVASWGLLGAMPFVLSFAVFNFSWRTAAVVLAGCLAVAVLGPLAIGELDEWWFLVVILLSAGGGAAVSRFGEEHAHDVSALNAQLRLTEERERVARDVHDVLGHSLTAVVLKAQVTDRMLAAVDDPPPELIAARQQLNDVQDVSRKALAEIRATVSGLRAVELGDELAAARSVLLDAEVELVVQGDPAAVPHRFHPALGMTVREAVTNIVRHADASQCSIELGGNQCLLAVRDNGVGGSDASEGNGLTGLRERLALEGLSLQIEHDPGTTLLIAPTKISP